ncbi:amino acid/polyamine/organocation transporter, APC superfamily [Anaerovirgula multivorans]|uniref:Amino acid/polyamine/organocation transporter, APC superfamily n=1 Tax=Anaerovirgula multivorans TaxID=312168 RepID=A0A239IZA1_9FIRM|nr:APC family permease [Anaerovirgula multivorans]SNS98538.1 amino acid/polyamine/organocation transporter, APC superfamily [Anaerovirgula multivorans]
MKNKEETFSRVLSQKDVMALSFGAMIGWGWVVLAGEWIHKAGTLGAMTAFLLGGVMVLFVGLTYAELTAAMPKCGGEHVFSQRALGKNASFICTWAIILGYISVVAFEAVAFPTVVEYLFPNYLQVKMYTVAGYDVYLTWVLVGVISSIAITVLNYYGVKPVAVMQGAVTIMVAVVGLSFFGGSLVNGNSQYVQPLFIDGMKGILAVAIMTPFMFVGFDVIPQAAEEIDMPFEKIGKILILSVVMAIGWYVMIILGISLSLPKQALEASTIPAADGMQAVFFNSSLASKAMVIAGIGGIITSWNSFFVGGSRAIYALAHSKQLPAFLGELHPKYKTPTNAILLIGILSSFAPLLGRRMLVWLVDAGGLTIVVAYFMVALSFLVLRCKEPNMPRPYKVKNGKAVGFIAVVLSLGMMVLYLPGAPAALIWPYEWMIVLGWTVLGVIFYVWAKLSYTEVSLKESPIEAEESI